MSFGAFIVVAMDAGSWPVRTARLAMLAYNITHTAVSPRGPRLSSRPAPRFRSTLHARHDIEIAREAMAVELKQIHRFCAARSCGRG